MKKRPPDAALTLARPSDLDIAGLLRRACPVLLVVGTWLAFHPYAGIVHDSRLYVAQALHALHPEVFGRDLFFAFGSQDDFSVYSRLFAPLLDRVGPSAAVMLVVVIGQALWLSGAAAMAVRLAPQRSAAVAGLVLVAVMPASYGGWNIFTYGEGFATPRLLAEGIGLWALWALTGGRLLWASALVVVAGLLHPLVAASALCVGFCYVVLQDWRWLLLGVAGVAAAAGLAIAGIAPFDGLLRTMDSEWLGLVEQRNIDLFPALWQPKDWGHVVTTAALAMAAVVVLSGWRRRLLLAGTVAGLGGLAATYVGADVLHNAFLIQIQIWRTLWLMQVFAYLGAGCLFVRLWQLQEDGLALIALIVFAWLAGLALEPVASAAIAAFSLVLAVMRLRGNAKPLPSVATMSVIILAGAAVGFLVVCRVIVLKGWIAAIPDAAALWGNLGHFTLIEAVFIATLAVAIYRLRPDTARMALPAASLVLVLASIAGWYRCAPWDRVLASAHPIAVFDAVLAPDAQVYWENDVRGPWLLLRRPSYFSRVQGAGIEFERRTALAYRDRANVVAPLTGRELLDSIRASTTLPPALPVLTRGLLVSTCRRDGALDAMVLSRAVPGAYAAQWDVPTPVYDVDAARMGVSRPPINRFYLYRCADLR